MSCVSTGQSGIRISSELGRGGYVKNCTWRNMSFSWQSTAGKTFLLHVNQDYKPDNPNKTLSFFSNLTFEGLVLEDAEYKGGSRLLMIKIQIIIHVS